MNTTTQTTGTTTLNIDGMTCGHCIAAVTKALSAVPGVKVKSVAVGSAVIETVDGWTTGKAVNALDEAGYSVKAVGDAASAGSPMPAKGGGGCCGGGNRAQPGGGSAMPQGGSGAKPTGGCCG